MKNLLAVLLAFACLVGCSKAPPPSPPAPRPLTASGGPSGTGLPCYIAGGLQPGAVNGATTGGYPVVLQGSADGGLCPAYGVITADQVAPGLSVSISGSGNATFEAGQTWTTTGITASPACSASGVTVCTLSDTLSNSVNDLGNNNPLSAPLSTYAESTQGATVGISLNLTQSSVNKTSNSLTSTWYFRTYAWANTSSACTSFTASGANGTLVGCSGTATGSSPESVGVGTSFTFTPSGTEYSYFACVHTATPHTFQEGGFSFPMSVVNTFSFTDHYGAATSFDVYQNPNPLTVSYTVTIVSDAARVIDLARYRAARRLGAPVPDREAA